MRQIKTASTEENQRKQPLFQTIDSIKFKQGGDNEEQNRKSFT